MKIDFLSKEPHHQDHARAIYDNLPVGYQGVFTDKIEDCQNRVIAVFAYGDLREVSRVGKKAVFCDHGVGMFYDNGHPSYAGSTVDRECVALRLSPNEIHAKKEREVLNCPVEVIGVPKMDKWANYKRPQKVRSKKTVVVSFHWDCHVVPETRSAWKYFVNALPELKQKYNLYGHSHPRIWRTMNSVYRGLGIRTMESFDEVMKNADVYVCDNSSTIFEFAFTKRPVVLLNSPLYRKDVSYEGNPRFWKFADIGPQVNKPTELGNAIEDAFKNKEAYRQRIDEAVRGVFVFEDGKSTQRAVEVITNFLKNYEDINIYNGTPNTSKVLRTSQGKIGS